MGLRSALVGVFALGGCAHVTIDEAFVFHPQPMDGKAHSESELALSWQHVLTSAQDWSIDYDVNGEKGRASGRMSDFVAYAVQHGFHGEGAQRIAYSVISSPSRDRPLIVHCGGNAADRRRTGVPYAVKALPYGDVLLFDYPGYGDSGGAPSAASFESMVERIGPFASELAMGRPIVFWGHSLGGFVCAELAARTSGAQGLVLEASARSAKAVAEASKPWWLRPFLDVRISRSLAAYDTAKAAVRADAPVLVLGAGRDRTLPAPLSRDLARTLHRAGAAVTYQEFSEANHVSIPQAQGFEAAVTSFFETIRENVEKDFAATGQGTR